MVRAVTDSIGDEKLAQSMYIKLRVQALKLIEAQARAEELAHAKALEQELLTREVSKKRRDHPYYCVSSRESVFLETGYFLFGGGAL